MVNGKDDVTLIISGGRRSAIRRYALNALTKTEIIKLKGVIHERPYVQKD